MSRPLIAAVLACSALAGSAPAQADPGPHVAYCGTVVEGVECTLFDADNAGLYIVAGLSGFGEGARVLVEGDLDPNCISFCQQGNGCIFNATVTSLSPVIYCTGKLNSSGCLPALVADPGSPSLSSGAWHVTATELVNQKPGIFFFGLASQALPFQGGTLCIAPPLARTPLQFSDGSPPSTADCSGLMVVDVASLTTGPFTALPDTLFLQAWSRDPLDPFGTSLSNAVEATRCP